VKSNQCKYTRQPTAVPGRKQSDDRPPGAARSGAGEEGVPCGARRMAMSGAGTAAVDAEGGSRPGSGAAAGSAEELPVLVARRLAVRFAPPTVILEYSEGDGSGGASAARKRRLRIVRLGVLMEQDLTVEQLAKRVLRSFPRRLDRRTLKEEQVRALVAQLPARVAEAKASGVGARGAGPAGAAAPVEDEELGKYAEEVDLCKVEQEELDAAKRRMDAGFQARRVRPGDERYEYDIRVDFEPVEDNDWDDSD